MLTFLLVMVYVYVFVFCIMDNDNNDTIRSCYVYIYINVDCDLPTQPKKIYMHVKILTKRSWEQSSWALAQGRHSGLGVSGFRGHHMCGSAIPSSCLFCVRWGEYKLD